jgi:hypothetical protein
MLILLYKNLSKNENPVTNNSILIDKESNKKRNEVDKYQINLMVSLSVSRQ